MDVLSVAPVDRRRALKMTAATAAATLMLLASAMFAPGRPAADVRVDSTHIEWTVVLPQDQAPTPPAAPAP